METLGTGEFVQMRLYVSFIIICIIVITIMIFKEKIYKLVIHSSSQSPSHQEISVDINRIEDVF